MPADPADIAKFTSDGVVLSTDAAAGAAVLAAHPNARSTDEGREVEMFFYNPAAGQLVLNERFTILSYGGPLHDGVEFERPAGGIVIPVAPNVPGWTVIDKDGSVTHTRTRSLAKSFEADKLAVEVLQ